MPAEMTNKQIIQTLEQVRRDLVKYSNSGLAMGRSVNADGYLVSLSKLDEMITNLQQATKKCRLTGDALAKEYAKRHPLSEENPGKCFASYEGGGWIEFCGNGLKALDGSTWTCLDRVRSSEARELIDDNFSELRRKYAEGKRLYDKEQAAKKS